jgi:hypothetical protein
LEGDSGGGADAVRSVKFTLTFILTGTGCPFTIVGA